ncbi:MULTISPECIES: YihY/virulence factor BrkB family protein [Vitreoscilla]|uniref:YihY/virulence factor BrkB family protein n=1 Tax=Vitreoscilla stercoraria TaxID=61 RepID=A0ABY4EE29_VITST|nr:MULTISPECIES: YihY/virulence factor BrkB family protein [Vitreoscilla]QJQ52136.1 virulence factor BrkB family protein [Vitreoscilla sp. C1]UOO93195.1 YihY/virulence factor BrkB family protein [Vitreoscilla stercoraria]
MPPFIQYIQSFVVKNPNQIDILTHKGMWQDLIWRVKNVDLSALGAQLAYFFLLSFFPLMIFFIGLIPYLNLNPSHVYELMADVMPPDIFKMVQQILSPILTHQNSNILSLGALGTLWSASKGMNALMAALNKAYNLETAMTFTDRLWSVIFTLLFLALLLMALVLPIFGGAIMTFVHQWIDVPDAIRGLWETLRLIMPALMIFVLLLAMYWIVPKTKPRLHVSRVFVGTSVASLGWLALTYGFSTYIAHFGNYSATYGSIGGVIVLMLWLYFTGMILIFGGIINATFQRRHDAKLRLKTPLTQTQSPTI